MIFLSIKIKFLDVKRSVFNSKPLLLSKPFSVNILAKPSRLYRLSCTRIEGCSRMKLIAISAGLVLTREVSRTSLYDGHRNACGVTY